MLVTKLLHSRHSSWIFRKWNDMFYFKHTFHSCHLFKFSIFPQWKTDLPALRIFLRKWLFSVCRFDIHWKSNMDFWKSGCRNSRTSVKWLGIFLFKKFVILFCKNSNFFHKHGLHLIFFFSIEVTLHQQQQFWHLYTLYKMNLTPLVFNITWVLQMQHSWTHNDEDKKTTVVFDASKDILK